MGENSDLEAYYKPGSLMPDLSQDKYMPVAQTDGVTPDDKFNFLTMYYKTGNMSLAAKLTGRKMQNFQYCLRVDPAFANDFKSIQDSMKNNLEQTMYQNGLKEKGYMDRITWLRRHYPKEYHPNYIPGNENPMEAIRELGAKLNEYQLVPKQRVIETEEEKNHST